MGAVAVLLAITVGASWQDNVLQPTTTKGVRFDLQVLVPQGWAFFTRSPQETSYVLYERVSGQWVRADSLPQSESENLFGFSREQRAQGTEVGVLASSVSSFTDCAGYLSECLAKPATRAWEIANPTNTQHFCGAIRVVQQEPVKFAYRNSAPEQVRVKSFADLEVTCSHN
ncbi:SdpA family antimicrobial peptide system protein [Leifsonia sp. ZF2019]|uniref:SdpA family antimicrobial peptide system protein n=1 Tax=Leifsonia sp. ZF2019 TaxID=2781978 RepID=UPI001CBD5757|nr:SdpA family antimicrobial peptide system protein [Leifsonia sp. ZF2019]UAJ79156.1 SdpA family antimicrobial peptide system protein [Leifsonia sp. ZF2019]